MLVTIKFLFLTLLLIGFSTSVHSIGDVTPSIGYQAINGSYSEESIKKSIQSNSLVFYVDILDDIRLTSINTDTEIKFDDPVDNIDQTSRFTSIAYNLYSDYEKINLRTDYHYIDNDDISGATDDVSINSYQTSILPYDNSYYAEIGFSKSKYPYTGNLVYLTPLNIKQINISYATNVSGSDWLTLKAYRINSSDKARSHDKASYNALETKYKYFLAENLANISNIELYVLTGKRIFAVNGATGSAYNTNDLQTGSLGLSAEWKFDENTSLLASVSKEKYLTEADVKYEGNYNYINFIYNF